MRTFILNYTSMKKIVLILALVFAISTLMTSCYTLTYSVGEGAKTGIEVKEKNHYLIYGLAPVKISDPTKMAGDAKDYTVTIQHTGCRCAERFLQSHGG